MMKRIDAGAAGSMDTVGLAVEVAAAYVSHNSLPPGDLPRLVSAIHGAFAALQRGMEAPPIAALEPAVPVKKSVQHDFLVCLEDGKKLKTLRRYLSRAFNMTPDEYRAKWGLSKDYPMVAPAYSEKRSALAKAFGLGQPRTATKSTKAAVARAALPFEGRRRGQTRKAA